MLNFLYPRSVLIVDGIDVNWRQLLFLFFQANDAPMGRITFEVRRLKSWSLLKLRQIFIFLLILSILLSSLPTKFQRLLRTSGLYARVSREKKWSHEFPHFDIYLLTIILYYYTTLTTTFLCRCFNRREGIRVQGKHFPPCDPAVHASGDL
jgi:hypothetical protein